MRSVARALVLSWLVAGCTKPNPAYCETTADCEIGICNEFHMCVELDAPTNSDGAGADGAGADAAGCEDLIAFVTARDGIRQIYTMQPDGSEQTNLTMTAVARTILIEIEPVWSPSGDRIAYVRDLEIWVVHVDGSAHYQLTDGHLDWAPTWSPDGARIAFMRQDASVTDPRRIWVVEADGGTPTQLTSGVNDNGPAWSPDGTQIAFVRADSGQDAEIYMMQADGTDEVPVTTNTFQDGDGGYIPPRWSPDGQQLLYVARQSGDDDIWVCGADGSNPRDLSNTIEDDSWPRWLADGSRIVFARGNATGGNDIYIMNADGSGRTPIETLPADDTHPAPSRDGAFVAWQSMRDGNLEVYSARTDGTFVRRLTDDAATDTAPAWRRCP